MVKIQMKDKICFIAQFPPPIHGLSKAVETLYNSDIQTSYNLEKIDITNNKKFLQTLASITKSKADLFYFTISQTRGGNLRDLIILKLLGLQKKRCVVHLHGGYYRELVESHMPSWQKNANYKEVKKLCGAIVLSDKLRPIFQGMLPDEKIYTVPNCVDNEFLISDEEFAKKLNELPSRKIKHILYLSNFISSKGYPEVLEMAKMEKARVDNGEERLFHFDFAGRFFEEKEKNFFDSFVNDNSLQDYITYHGIVSGDKKRELLQNSDIFILLTRYPNEGQPISILEAMGNGMIVITTNHAGIPDIMNESYGVIIGSKTSNLAQEAYNSLFGLEYQKMMSASRNEVLQKYTQDKYIRNMKNTFDQLLADQNRANG